MARSRRKTPIFGITTAESDKAFKIREHRRERRAVNVALRIGDEPPAPKEFGDPWKSDKDGKTYYAERPEMMRK